ncbi:MAG: hypothetical protein SGARI_000052 [Bacillariaceae sp.]
MAPSLLVFGSGGVQFLANLNGKDTHRVKDLDKFVFHLQKIQRRRQKWELLYFARDRDGVGEVVAGFKVSVGEISRESQSETHMPRLGLKGELVSYFPAKTAPLVRGLLKPCAVLTIDAGKNGQAKWEAISSPTTVDLSVSGIDPEASNRYELGLLDKAHDDLKWWARNGPQKKHYKNALERKNRLAEERRWTYPEDWKEWPATLQVESSADGLDIEGTYQRASCRQTINQSALWIREAGSKASRYLIIKPNVGRTGPDTAIISASISPDDVSDILVSLPSWWQPCDALSDSNQKMKAEKSNWQDVTSKIVCVVPKSNIEISTGRTTPELLALQGLSESEMSMLRPFHSAPADSEVIKLNVHHGVESQKIIRSFNYLCVPQIMRHVAQDSSLSQQFSPNAPWRLLQPQDGNAPFGTCQQTIPLPPNEQWQLIEDRWARVGNPEQSRIYYESLDRAPTSFEFILDKKDRCLSIKCFPQEPMSVLLRQGYQLYERQQKVVRKMVMIENGQIEYEEIEMAEHEMPGSTGLSVVSKASSKRKLSGGVVCDAIGAGKTLVSIALILNGLYEARASRCFPRKSGATLVVGPAVLLKQWESEINKFSDGLNVLCIYDTAQLQSTTVGQIIEADVVMAPINILELNGYINNLMVKSRLENERGYEIPVLPKKIYQKEKAGAAGVWIPATSRDPYGIGANEATVSWSVS